MIYCSVVVLHPVHVLIPELRDDEEYYNIEGRVGSRVAQQLQKGDKIRVGINGRIQSDDLRVKRQDFCISRQ